MNCDTCGHEIKNAENALYRGTNKFCDSQCAEDFNPCYVRYCGDAHYYVEFRRPAKIERETYNRFRLSHPQKMFDLYQKLMIAAIEPEARQQFQLAALDHLFHEMKKDLE